MHYHIDFQRKGSVAKYGYFGVKEVWTSQRNRTIYMFTKEEKDQVVTTGGTIFP